jgi:phenylpropionate dioxygenase-like ring-hydroxylating dioxygenase large terminal subunit
MDLPTQVALIDRINAHRSAGRGTDMADASWQVPVSTYTDPERFDAERRLLRTLPTVVGLSGLVPEPNSYATVGVGDVSVIVTRGPDGEVAAMLNVCRHRGAQVTEGCGRAARLACPYHGWTYQVDGAPAARRRDEYFTDQPMQGLTRLPIAERDGLIWVSVDPDGRIPDQPLTGAEAELAPFGLGSYRLFGTRTFSRKLNWKLAVDTFCESYHVGSLHRETLAPLIHSDFALFDAAGLHGRMIATRRSIADLDGLDRDEWSLLPHATILWFLVPNTVLIYQQDHVQVYQTRPGAGPDEAHLSVSVYVPPDSTRTDAYWNRNFDLLIDVTDAEDLTTAAGIQRNFYSGAQDAVVFGRNEPALQHYHRSINDLLETR